eukprot:13228985-Heterocapsa_arctica.AAC.1
MRQAGHFNLLDLQVLQSKGQSHAFSVADISVARLAGRWHCSQSGSKMWAVRSIGEIRWTRAVSRSAQ